MATSIREKYVDRSHSEFPKFVFCIPQELTYMRGFYENHLLIEAADSYSEHVTWKQIPFRATPMIFDTGYAEGRGFDTTFALCHKIKHPWRYYLLSFDSLESSSSLEINSFFTLFQASNNPIPFLDIFFSFDNSSGDVFLSGLKQL